MGFVNKAGGRSVLELASTSLSIILVVIESLKMLLKHAVQILLQMMHLLLQYTMRELEIMVQHILAEVQLQLERVLYKDLIMKN